MFYFIRKTFDYVVISEVEEQIVPLASCFIRSKIEDFNKIHLFTSWLV
jgi:hypothetical protein